MKKLILILSLLLTYSFASFAQITKENETFADVPIVNSKVVFIKEVKVPQSGQYGYEILREWARENYGGSPFVSSVSYNSGKREITAKSKIELILPPNEYGYREEVVMKYRIDGFIFGDKCVLEISDITYLYKDAKTKRLPRVVKAEDAIADKAVQKEEAVLQELRINTRKSTLYFLNNLTTQFEEKFGY